MRSRSACLITIVWLLSSLGLMGGAIVWADDNGRFDPPKEGQDDGETPITRANEKAEAEARADLAHKAEVAQQEYRKRMTIAHKEVTADIQACMDKYQARRLKTHAQVVSCYNTKIMAAFMAAGYPYPDLLKLLAQKRLEVARLIDKKIYTEPEAEAELAEFSKKVQDEEQKRDARQAAAANAAPLPSATE